MVSTSSITMQSYGEDHTTCASCRCENVMFVAIFFVCHTLRPERCLLLGEWGHSSNKYCVTVYGSILMRFSPYFQKGSAFQMQYMLLIFVTRWHHKFRKMAVKNCDKCKNRRKSFCTPLCIDS